MVVLLWAWGLVCAVAGVPLQRVDYEVYATGPLAELTVHQTFVNDGTTPVDAIYVFPMHERAAVDGMVLRVGDRVIEGAVLDKNAAITAYDQAVDEGKTAALTTQQRPNLFTQRVGNIPPGETVEVSLRAIWPVLHEDGAYRLVVPLLAAPRFVRPDQLDAIAEDPMGLLANEPLVADGAPAPNAGLDLVVDSGLTPESFDCPSHNLPIEVIDSWRREAHADVAMDRDLACRWTVSPPRPELSAWLQHDHLLLTLDPPDEAPQPQEVGRELIWVIDESCSMRDHGAMDLVKRAMHETLDHVDARDTLRILTFSDGNRGDRRPMPATHAALERARLTVDSLSPNGGTRLLEGVVDALDTPPDPTRDRMVIFMSDGLVDNERHVLASIADRLGNARLFALGAGPAPNRYLLDEMARFGGGKTTWLRAGEDPTATTRRFVQSIDRAVLSELVIDWGDWEVEEPWPQRPPALYAGQPASITARVVRRGTSPITVYGRQGDREYARSVSPRELPEGRVIPSTWARQKIAGLEGQLLWGDVPDLRDEIRATSLAYQVLSQYTAFLAIDHQSVRASSREAEREPDREREPQPSPDRSSSPVEDVAEPTALDQDVSYTGGGDEITIDVIAHDDAVDVEDTAIGDTLTRSMLDRLPANRSYTGAVNRVPGVVPGGANQQMGGGSYNENEIIMDGVKITDPVTGTFSANFNFDAIEQIEVLLGGYMPEHGNALGGIVNVTTQSGTNNLEFMAGAYYGNGNLRTRIDERLTADGLVLSPTGFDSTFELAQLSTRVSGPLLRDKAWFFFSHQYDHSVASNTGIPQKRAYEGHYVLSKLAVQPAHEHRFTALLQADPTSIDNVDQGNPYQKAEAQGRQVQGGFVAQGKWQWFPSANSSLETTVSTQKSFIEVGGVPCTHDPKSDSHPCEPGEREGQVDWETPGRIGVGGAFSSTNFSRFTFDDRFRHVLSSKLSLLDLRDPFGGRHDVKLGVEGNQLVWDQVQGFPGNLLFVDINEVPFDPDTLQSYYWIETTGPVKFRTTGSQLAAFAQDSWKPLPRLVVNGGVRWDRTTMRNDVGEPVLAANLLSPRLYASWDPFGRQRTKIATGYGRFADTGRLAVADFLSNRAYGSHLYLGEFFSDFPTGVLNDSANDYDTSVAVNKATAAPNLGTPRVDEVILKLQHEIVTDFAASSDITARFVRNQYEYDETNLIYDSDGSTVIGARNTNPTESLARMRTPLLARRDYFRWDLGLQKVRAHRWEASATYSYTSSRGSTEGALSGSFANDPQTRFNYGPMTSDIRHAFKSWGWWDLPLDPWTATLGATLDAYAGAPFERLYTAENDGSGFASPSNRIRPRGTYFRLDPWWTLGLRDQQAIDVRKGKLVIDLQATNLLDNAAPLTVDYGYLDSNNRLLTTTRQDPRRYTAGVRYEF